MGLAGDDGPFDYQFSSTPVLERPRPPVAPVVPPVVPPEPVRRPVPEQTTMLWGNPAALLVAFNAFQPFGYGISSGGVYDPDPYRNGGTDAAVMPDARLAALHNAGATAFRMAVDVGPLCAAADDAVLDGFIAQIIEGARRRVYAGFRVIIDAHVLGLGQHSVSGWSQSDLVDGPDGPKFTRLKTVLARLGRAMWLEKDRYCPPYSVCLELFNEPAYTGEYDGHEPWASVQAPALHAAVRAVTGHTLLIGGTDWNNINDLGSGLPGAGCTALDPAQFDANTGFTFHPYESSLFSHQGVDGVIYEDVVGLKFPASANPGGRSAVEATISAAIAANPTSTPEEKAFRQAAIIDNVFWSSSVATYFGSLGNKPGLAARLKILTDWADAHGVSHRRLFNTEYGAAVSGIDNLSLRDFLYAVRDAAQNAGIGMITLHEVQGSDFGVQMTAPPWTINSYALEGLGLTPYSTTTIENRAWPSNNLGDTVPPHWFAVNGGAAASVAATNPTTGEMVAWDCDAGAGFGGRGLSVALAAGTYTWSAYMKTTAGTIDVQCNIDGVFLTPFTVTTTLTRFTHTFTTAGGDINCIFGVNAASGSVRVDSVQVNAGATALTYVHTDDSPGSIEVP